jgi:agmatinase
MRQIDATKSPRFSQISTFARLPCTRDLSGVKAAFVGVPFDDATTYRSGARFGPSAVRQGSRLLRPYNPFVDAYPFDDLNACDYGDIDVVPGYVEDTLKVIEEEASRILGFSVPFFAGGDHSVTLPILRATRKKLGRVNLVHFDSHYDFWDTYWGKKYTHGTWLRRAIEEELVADVVQLGVRGSLYSKEDVAEEKRLGVKTFNIKAVKREPEAVREKLLGLKGKTYVSLDIDVVDPAFAPGTGTPEVGGLTSFEVVELIRSLKTDLAGFDVVEVSPPYDVSELTAMMAANIFYEAMSVLALKR